jgi:hypothetical protein
MLYRIVACAGLFVASTACQGDVGVTARNSLPTVSISNPEAGSKVREGYPVMLRGSASDPGAAAETLSVTWYIGNEVVCEASAPLDDKGSTECEVVFWGEDSVTLEVRDAENATASDARQLVVVATGDPEVAIQSPSDSARFYGDDLVELHGFAVDAEEAPGELVVGWESSISGPLDVEIAPNGVGEHVTWTLLEPGAHVLTLSATDFTGKTAKETVQVVVGAPNSPPSCAVTSPIDAPTAVGSDVLFQGTVGDADEDFGALSVTWSSDRDGFLASSTPSSAGDVGFSAPHLSKGTHAITLEVTDERGLTCTDFVFHTVDAPPEVVLLSPKHGDVEYAELDTVFEVVVSDEEDQPTLLTIEWRLNGGVLSVKSAGADGVARFSESIKPGSQQDLEVVVTDSHGLSVSAFATFDVVDCPLLSWFADVDEDGRGDAGSELLACDEPDGFVSFDDDCDDGDGSVYPGADELCDGKDNDCDVLTTDDDGPNARTWFFDGDGDGFAGDTTSVACDDPGAPWYAVAGDCDDDSDATIFPGAPELCDGLDNDCDVATTDDHGAEASAWYFDADGDGFAGEDMMVACDKPGADWHDSAMDCDDDTDAAIYPNAPELCDGKDNDCDSATTDDDGTESTRWYLDADGDGFAGDATSSVHCEAPSAYWFAVSSDCDNDTDATIYPNAPELCDGKDNDCNSATSDDSGDEASVWYLDEDGDGYAGATSFQSCDDPGDDWYETATDCGDDTDATVFPNAPELCDGKDNDCDASTTDDEGAEASTWFLDDDGDGFAGENSSVACDDPGDDWYETATDCDDDTDATIFPDAPELCDGKDNDCDADTTDDQGPEATTWFVDEDGDGFAGSTTVSSCGIAESNWYVAPKDCDDDTDGTIFPGAPELCDGKDNDCDVATTDNDSAEAVLWYFDSDADGFAGTAHVQACEDPGDDWYAAATDCDDDTDNSVFPNAPELCDGKDNDCDSATTDDDSADALTWYFDGDGDGFAGDTVKAACVDPGTDWYEVASDCDDDTDAAIYPNAPELCDGKDNDCDGATTDDDSAEASTWYLDSDGDGFAGATTSVHCADPGQHWYSANTDCDDDTDGTIFPEAPELCDGKDNDCDEATSDDDSVEASVWYFDGDGDGHAGSVASVHCEDPGADWYALASDCDDDSDETIFPGAPELCDGKDNDCNGATSDDEGPYTPSWYFDGDGDGFAGATHQVACNDPGVDWYSEAADCDDDTDATIFPDAPELCDGKDNDCDVVTTDDDSADALTWYFDGDGDGFAGNVALGACVDPGDDWYEAATDCQDSEPSTYPGAPELCDAIDNDCDPETSDGIEAQVPADFDDLPDAVAAACVTKIRLTGGHWSGAMITRDLEIRGNGGAQVGPITVFGANVSFERVKGERISVQYGATVTMKEVELVAPGVFSGPVLDVTGSTLELDDVILDQGPSSYPIPLSDSLVVGNGVEVPESSTGFEVRGGALTLTGSFVGGRLPFKVHDAEVTLDDVEVRDSGKAYSSIEAAFYLHEGANVVVRDSDISDINDMTVFIPSPQSASITFVDCEVSSSKNGGFAAQSDGSISLIRTEVYGLGLNGANAAIDVGGSASVYLEDSEFGGFWRSALRCSSGPIVTLVGDNEFNNSGGSGLASCQVQ